MNIKLMLSTLYIAILTFTAIATQSIALATPIESSSTSKDYVHPIVGRRPSPPTGRKACALIDELLTKNKLILPLRNPSNPKSSWITSWVNLKGKGLHLHLEGEPGAPVRAATTGKVLYTGWFGGYGKVVIIAHSDKLHTLYGHLSKILVSGNEVVKRGQAIGIIGTTGFSTSKIPNVCFEIRPNLNETRMMQQSKVDRTKYTDRSDKHNDQFVQPQ